MCRLCAITASNLGDVFDADRTDEVKVSLLHELMMRGCVEEQGQRNGWGVTDGRDVWRSSAWYVESAPHYLNAIDTSGIVMGHVRKASTGTHLTTLENHPFKFDLPGDTCFWGAHNGWIDGSKPFVPVDGVPHSDSWYAFADLQKILADNNNPELDARIVQEWLSKYAITSHYAFLIMYKDKLTAIRGDTRPLHILPIGDGYLINTSKTVLDTMAAYTRALMPEVHVEEPLHLLNYSMYTFELGNREYGYEAFKIERKQAGFQVPPAARALPAPSAETAQEPVSVTRALTRPRNSTKEDDNAVAEWRRLSGKLSPLRSSLSRFWVASALGYLDSDGVPITKDLLRLVSDAELELVSEILVPTSIVDDKEVVHKPYSATATLMLNWWNHAVRPGMDIDAHLYLFGKELFWLDPRYTAGPVATSYADFNRWVTIVKGRILYEMPADVISSLFDMPAIIAEDRG